MSHKDTAGVWLPPPLVYLGLLGLGYGAELRWPLPWLPPAAAPWIGGGLVGLSLLLFALVLREFLRHHTSVDHLQPSRTLITRGPFRYSRNPIYLSMILFSIGVAALINSSWGWVAAALATALVHRFVVLKEEAYLERRFGAAYRDYQARVRRWL